MAGVLAGRLARRLSLGGSRGLSDALGVAGASSMELQAAQQPWMLTALRAHGGGGSGGGSGEASSSGSMPPGPQPAMAPSLAVEDAAQASSSGRAVAEAAATAVVAAAGRPRPPPGHTDFQQRQLLMLFTCSKCNTRAAKAFSKQSYEQGVVIVECPGCNNRHLIADHLGWFGQKGTVEQFAAERGGTVMKRLADGTVELTPEDLLGASLVQETAAAQATAAAQEAAAAAQPAGASGGSAGSPGAGQ